MNKLKLQIINLVNQRPRIVRSATQCVRLDVLQRVEQPVLVWEDTALIVTGQKIAQ
jgi:hypothetical protein